MDYYAHSELEWNLDALVYPNRQPAGFAQIAMEYVERYNLPVMLTETNIRGGITDRISWLKLVVEQCEILEKRLAPKNIPFRGFCWYPFIDSTDWCSLVRRADGKVDPQGIFYLCSDWQRNASELSETFASLACGAISSEDIPAYRFASPLDKELAGFLPLMKHLAMARTIYARKRREIGILLWRSRSKSIFRRKERDFLTTAVFLIIYAD